MEISVTSEGNYFDGDNMQKKIVSLVKHFSKIGVLI
jgi:hypothetical protein